MTETRRVALDRPAWEAIEEAVAPSSHRPSYADPVWPPGGRMLKRIQALLQAHAAATPPGGAAKPAGAEGEQLALELPMIQWRRLQRVLADHIHQVPDPDDREPAERALEGITSICGPPPVPAPKREDPNVRLDLSGETRSIVGQMLDLWLRINNGRTEERVRAWTLRRDLQRADLRKPVEIRQSDARLLCEAVKEAVWEMDNLWVEVITKPIIQSVEEEAGLS